MPSNPWAPWAGWHPEQPQAAPQLTIEYRPGLELSKIFRQINKWTPIFFVSLIGVFIVGIPMHIEYAFLAFAKFIIAPIKPFLLAQNGDSFSISVVAAVVMPMLWIFGAALTALTFREGYKPTHLRITEYGAEIIRRVRVKSDDGWHDSGKFSESIVKMILWNEVTRAWLHRKTGKRSHMDYEIRLDIRTSSRKETYSIRYGDIENPFERMQFLNALENLLADRFDPEIKQVFSDKGERESYTELWLKELNAPPKRDKLVPLSAGMRLHNNEYCIREKIGIGGQGAVYLAESAKAAALVAIKEFILPVFPDPRVRRSAAERFQTEAELISKINHPQIVRFLDLFIEDHRAYLVLERVPGRNLKQIVEAEGVMKEERVLALARQMCDILAYLHEQAPPIAHRDFTPDNLMLGDGDVLKLIDFSVAQAAVSNVTGSVVGKAEYIAPEQFRGKPTPLSDLYSLGGTLYFLLTGNNPEAISVSKPVTCSAALADVIAKATALDPAKRFQSAREMQAALSQITGSTDGGVIHVAVQEERLDRK